MHLIEDGKKLLEVLSRSPDPRRAHHGAGLHDANLEEVLGAQRNERLAECDRVAHGARDPVVPLQQSELMLSKMKKAGVTAQLLAREGKGHRWRSLREDLKSVADWFDKHLGK